MKSFIFAFLALALSAILLFYRYVPRELPADTKIELRTGKAKDVTVIGKSKTHLTIRDKETLECQRIQTSDLSYLKQQFLRFLPDQPPLDDTYPFHKTLTNLSGKSFKGIVTGNSNGHISVKRKRDESTYTIPIDTLSVADQDFFRSLPDSQSAEIDRVLRGQKFAGRHATWHRQLHNAIQEAEQTKLPIMVLFKTSAGEESSEIDSNVFTKSEFREWANQNVVLCMFYSNPDRERGTKTLNGLSSAEGREMAKKFNVGSRTPIVLILNSAGEQVGQIGGYTRESATSYISRIEKELP